MSNRPVIAYLGMTHLGLCSGIAAASKGFTTIGFDRDPALVARIDGGTLPVIEPGLDALFAEHRERLSFTSDPAALAQCDVLYVAPDVPTDDRGGSDYSTLDPLLAIALANARADATVVILSQVAPGYTRAN